MDPIHTRNVTVRSVEKRVVEKAIQVEKKPVYESNTINIDLDQKETEAGNTEMLMCEVCFDDEK